MRFFSNTVLHRFWGKPKLSHRLVSGTSVGFLFQKKENKKVDDRYIVHVDV